MTLGRNRMLEVIGAVLLIAMTPLAAAANQGDARRGETLYRAYSCYACHGYTGETGLATRLNPPRFNQEAFLHYIRNPSGKKLKRGSGGWMPPYRSVPDEDLMDIHAYLVSLESTSPALEDIPLLQGLR